MADASPSPGPDPYGQDEFTGARADRRTVSELAAALTRWYRAGPPQQAAATATDVVVPGGGASSDLFLVRIEDPSADTSPIAVRLAPSYAVYPVVDLALQFDVATAAHRHSSAPIPRPLWHETDTTWLGAEFIVTDAAPGVVGGDVGNGWTSALVPAEQRRVWERSIDALVALHACDLDAAGITQAHLPSAGSTALDRAITYWERYLEFVCDGDEFPLLATAVARSSLTGIPARCWTSSSAT
jgi:aminoglycoside phosphotransferase (APT) family kinase protein